MADNDAKLKITSDGRWGHTHVTVGDQELRVSELTISWKDRQVVAQMTVLEPLVDIEVLQRNTELNIKRMEKDNG